MGEIHGCIASQTPAGSRDQSDFIGRFHISSFVFFKLFFRWMLSHSIDMITFSSALDFLNIWSVNSRLGCLCHPYRSQTSAPPATAGYQLQILRARANHCLSPTTTKYRKCRNSILILCRHHSDSEDVLEASVTVAYSGSMKRSNKSKKKREAKRGGKLRRASKPARKSEAMVPLPAAWEQ